MVSGLRFSAGAVTSGAGVGAPAAPALAMGLHGDTIWLCTACVSINDVQDDNWGFPFFYADLVVC